MTEMEQFPSIENEHHNVPRSRGGSNHLSNISNVDKTRHTAFHERWANNYTLDDMLRILALNAIGFHDTTLRPDVFSRVTQIAKISKAHLFYKKEALTVDQTSPHANQKIRTNALKHFKEEKEVAEEVATAIQEGTTRTRGLMKKCTAFFGTDKPNVAMASLLTETQADGELAWAKAMQDHVRLELLSLLEADPVPLTMDAKHELMPAILAQAKQVKRYINQLEPSVIQLPKQMEERIRPRFRSRIFAHS